MSDTKCPNIKIYKCSDGFVTDNAQVAKSHEANIKSNKLICPFCQQELETWAKYTDGTSKVWCSKCNLFGDSKLFSELIRTRKALDVAVDALGYYASENSWDETNRWMFVENGFEFARDVLVKIDKTLEQKEVK